MIGLPPRSVAARLKPRRRHGKFAMFGSAKVAEKAMKPYTQNVSRWPRYRWRTWIRGHVPWALVSLFPRGSKDCGEHEWFRVAADTDWCLHCEVGERKHQHTPIDWGSELWRELSQSADEGNPVSRQIVDRMRIEEKAAQRVA